MTLVVTEVSQRFGCVLVGDSAVTVTTPGAPTQIRFGASKIHYSSSANIGFAVWGNACLDGKALDRLLVAFSNSLQAGDTPSSAGQALADHLSQLGQRDGRGWDRLKGGVHIAGFEDGFPVLFHVHTGGGTGPQHAPTLHKDFPVVPDAAVMRNGYHPMFNALFPGLQNYGSVLNGLGFSWPLQSIEDRVSFYEIAVNTVAQTLKAAGRNASVGGDLSSLAFTRNGLVIDKRLPAVDLGLCTKGILAEFAALPHNDACCRRARVR